MTKEVVPTSVHPLSKGHEDFYGKDIILDVRAYSRELWNQHEYEDYEPLEPGVYLANDEDTVVFDIVVDNFMLFRGNVEKKIEELNKEYDMDLEIKWEKDLSYIHN